MSNILRARRHANPFSVRPPEQPLDLSTLFAKAAPLEVEIGPSGGRFLLARAQQATDVNILGLEVRFPMVERLAERIERLGLPNAAVLLASANTALSVMLPEASVQKVYAFHPDPWIKKRHLKRRLFQPELVETLAKLLVPGGYLIAQSDIRELAEEIRDRVEAHGAFQNLAGDKNFASENPTGISSETELYWLERGDPVYYLHFQRR